MSNQADWPKTPSAADMLSMGLQIQSSRKTEYNPEGKEENSFALIAEMFNAATHHRKNLSPSDVALILDCLKKVRQYSVPDRIHHDSLVDSVNYTAFWGSELIKELGTKK